MPKHKILIHVPYPFLEKHERTSASRVRPYHMYKAFLKLGFKVDLIAGDVPTRKKQVLTLSTSKSVDQYLFCYSEPSTYPVHPLLDYGFYFLLARKGIPIGIYYRDAYWKFADWVTYRGWKGQYLLSRYKLDLAVFSRVASVVFFQSQSMADLFRFTRKVVLPPGGQILYENQKSPVRPPSQIRTAIYVGGISPRYGLEVLLQSFARLNERVLLNLELVCRKDEYARERAVFDKYAKAKWLHIHHLTEEDLGPIYWRSDIAISPLRRNFYNDFTLPVKIFEYLSHGLPIVATDCTETANFIRGNKVGLIAKDDAESLAEKILQLVRDRDLYEELKHNVRRTLENGNLWTDRAQLVAQQLTALDKRRQ